LVLWRKQAVFEAYRLLGAGDIFTRALGRSGFGIDVLARRIRTLVAVNAVLLTTALKHPRWANLHFFTAC
jgi:hypothetical protein